MNATPTPTNRVHARYRVLCIGAIVASAAVLLVLFWPSATARAQASGESKARWEYASLYHTGFVDIVWPNAPAKNEVWRFNSAELETGELKAEDFAKKLGIADAKDVRDIVLLNRLAADGWELIAHSLVGWSVVGSSSYHGTGGTSGVTIGGGECWHFRRAK